MKCFVFGSNRQGIHGAGAAYDAVKSHGVVLGISQGLQGNSYAIVTKELRKRCPPVTIAEVKEGVDRFLRFARKHPEMVFELTPIGCGLAGFHPWEIAPLFTDAPSNVEMPEVFKEYLS